MGQRPRVTDRLYHERDGSGYIKPGFSHLFVVPAQGGTARQISTDNFHHRQPEWHSDGKRIYVSGNRNEDWQYDYRNTEIYSIDVDTGATAAITSTSGPDEQPRVAPSGRWLAWLGFSDRRQAFKRPDCGLHDLMAQGCGNCWLISIAVSTPWHGPPTARACSYSTMTGDEPGLPTSAWPMKCGWWPQTWAAPALADPMAAALSPSLTMTAWPTPIPARNFPLK